MTAIVGIPACAKLVNGFPRHDTPARYAAALVGGAEVLAVMIPPLGATQVAVLDRLDGLLVPGSPSNVHPSLYGGPPHPDGTPEDPARDAATLPLIRAAVARGVPVLAICRGFQELNVALGGTLHQRLQDLPGRFDHSTPMQPFSKVRTGKAHAIRVVAGSWLHRLAGATEIAVNSLHNQGIDRLALRLIPEGTAPDGTIEAVRVADAPGFAVGIQWHPEYDFETDALSRRIFESFAEAVRGRAGLAAAAD